MDGSKNAAQPAPSINGRAYPIIDHTFDVVVVGAGGAGLRATLGARRSGLKIANITKVFPDAQPHGRGARRHLGRARQYGRGRLALAHVRHREGVGLARRPGRDRISLPQRARRRLRARAFRRAVQPHRRRQDLSARLRRHDQEFRRRRRSSAPAPPPTAPATRSCIRSTARACATTRCSSSSTSRSISSWRKARCRGVMAWCAR